MLQVFQFVVGWGSPVRLYHGRVLYGRWRWLERWRSVHTAMEETKYGITQKPHERLFVKCSGGSKWTLCRGYNSTWHLLLHIVTSLFLFYSPDATPGVHMAFWTPTSQFYFIHVLKKDHGPGEPFKAITGIFCSCCSLKIYLRNCNFFLLPIYRPR